MPALVLRKTWDLPLKNELDPISGSILVMSYKSQQLWLNGTYVPSNLIGFDGLVACTGSLVPLLGRQRQTNPELRASLVFSEIPFSSPTFSKLDKVTGQHSLYCLTIFAEGSAAL